MTHTARFCPLCDQRVDAPVCPHHDVPTVRADLDTVEAVDPALGRIYAGRYRVEHLLGQGGMGRVYAATQLSIERQVALKLLHPRHSLDSRYVRRFYREARAATRLASPHVVQVHDFGVDDDSRTPFIAMELLDGRPLSALLQDRGPLGVREAAGLLAQIARALAEAEAASIVHRDLKPDNIIVLEGARGPTLKVADFGIAKELGREDTQTLTAEGAAIGTPAYMAPEQVDGREIDHRADLYALGCILHEMLLGTRLFAEQGRANQMIDHLIKPAPQLPTTLPSGESTPEALRQLHQDLLAKSPEDRPQSAREVLPLLDSLASQPEPVALAHTALRATPTPPATTLTEAEVPIPQPRPRPTRRWRWAWAAAIVGLGGGAAATFALGGGPEQAPLTAQGPTAADDADGTRIGTPPAPKPPVVVEQPPPETTLPTPIPPNLEQLTIRGAAATVRVRQSAEPRPIRVLGDASRVQVEAGGARLILAISDAPDGQSRAGSLQIDVEVPSLAQLKISGSATVIAEDPIRAETLALRITGSARATLNVAAETITSTIRGTSSLQLAGVTERHDARTGGATKLDAFGLRARVVALTTEGTGDAVVHATEQLDLTHDSAGEVVYYGQPKVVNRSGEGEAQAR